MRLIAALALLTACALPADAQKVYIDSQPDTDFSKLKKYAWREHPFNKGTDNAKKFYVADQLVQSDANDILMGRGYVPVDTAPDFYITYFVKANVGQEVTTVASPTFAGAYMWPGSWYAWSGAYFANFDTYTTNYLEGILVLDIVDAKTDRLIWRSVAKARIDDMKTRDKVIEKAVTKSLAQFPPKPKKK